ncbi:UDP-N-acetyl-D-mannosamine transferase [Devosia epidermidihirudinis]|uniref:UDP-N-acetyl-D-mannosamine transferase n=1 Tax=Devosia epidermidihirudinis TaxID=1293439 RepID=A0A0F5QFP2_9HYPH|nr:WecB/TagA/CpsF family glycosyltransferase [Devosia epidermidihirudinis]KKC38844.1 UDP-N-acetyl-D-mannosamine transferase [Devosia epidermidihirudinis]
MAFAVDGQTHDEAAPRSTLAQSRLLFGLNLDGLCMSEAVSRCDSAIQTRQPLLIGVVNAAKIVNMRHDPALRDALLDCNMLLADGQSIVWASKLLHKPLPERVAGIDLFENLLSLAHARGHSIYLLGAKPEVLTALQLTIAKRWPRMRISGSHHGYFNDQEADAIAQEIRTSGADMLFLGMASPKKEIFLRRYHKSLNVPVMHGVGGSFDVMAGLTKRAPLAWQKLGLEWAYRLLQEPGRMWKRYLTTNSVFIALTVREAVRPSPAYAQDISSPQT